MSIVFVSIGAALTMSAIFAAVFKCAQTIDCHVSSIDKPLSGAIKAKYFSA